MVIFSAKKEESQLLEKRVKELLGSELPDLVWVNNLQENYRFWGIYPLYAPKGSLLRDTILPLGRYGIVLPKGSSLKEYLEKDGMVQENEGKEWTLSGKIAFQYTGGFIPVEKAVVNKDGVLKFSILADLEKLGAGIRYVKSAYDEQVERTVFKTLYAEVFIMKEIPELEIGFFPAQISQNRWKLLKPVNAETVLQTVYLQKIAVSLPRGFEFELAKGADVNGYEELYFTPSGSAAITKGGFLMPGLTGSEMIETGKEMCFCPGGNAYFEEPEIKVAADTAYLSFPSAVYYTQPHHMNFYNIEKEGIYQHTTLPGVSMGEVRIPLFPFGGLKENSKDAIELETNFLSRMRKAVVEDQIEENMPGSKNISCAVTRNGMKAAYDSRKIFWMQTVPLKELMPGLAYTSMEKKFWFSLLSANLFQVLVSLKGRASVPYSITNRRLKLAEVYGYRDWKKLEALGEHTYYSEEELKAAVEGAGAEWNDAIKEACCHFNQNLAGWEFRCSPDRWENQETLAVLKLVDNKSLNECMADPELWSLKLEEEEIKRAEKCYANVSVLDASRFEMLGEIKESREWRGSVFFQAGADVSGMPAELAFLAKGIDESRFMAAYVVFPAVSASGEESAAGSALIHYEDFQKLHFEEYQEFGFKVRQLELDIRKNRIYSFFAEAELLINRIFGAKTAGKRNEEDCSLIFAGSYQEDEKGGYYAFAMEQPVEYILCDCGIERVCIESASLRAEGESGRFVLGGTLVLNGGEETDLLSFAKLPFEGLVVEMRTCAAGYDFHVDYGSLVLHPEQGELREGSFGALFPAKISRLLIQNDMEATDLGFETLKIKGYEDEKALGKEWIGFLWLIETGNLGGLAAKTNLTLELLTAFSPDPENAKGFPHFYCGLRIKSLVKTDTFTLPLQGIMSLGFDAMELRKEEDFYFRFRNFSLTILGKRFPESNNDLYLITDKDGNLGWYGAVEG